MWTHPWSGYPAWCRDSDLELIKGRLSWLNHRQTFKRVQRPPVKERTAVLKDGSHQAPTPARKEFYSTTTSNERSHCSSQQSRQRTQLVSAQTVAHTDHETMSVCVLNHWLAVQRGRVINILDTLEHGPQQLVGITPITLCRAGIKFPC